VAARYCIDGDTISEAGSGKPFYLNDTLLRQSLHDLTPFGFERILSGA
jgi:hypothetical protein